MGEQGTGRNWEGLGDAGGDTGVIGRAGGLGGIRAPVLLGATGRGWERAWGLLVCTGLYWEALVTLSPQLRGGGGGGGGRDRPLPLPPVRRPAGALRQ